MMSLAEFEKKYTRRLAIVTFIIVAALPLTLYLVQQSQEPRKLASGPKGPFAPYVAISSPLEGQTVAGSTSINVTILNEADVAAVEVYVDDKQKAQVTRKPFTYTWDSRSDSAGPHNITIRALDNNGSVGINSITVYKEE